MEGRPEVLCNNPGVMALPGRATKDGHEVSIQTNCLSRVLRTREPFDLIAPSDDRRIVNHTSAAHAPTPPRSPATSSGPRAGPASPRS